MDFFKFKKSKKGSDVNKKDSLNKSKKLKIKLPSFALPKIKIGKASFVSGGITAIDPYTQKAYNYSKNLIQKGSVNFYDKKNSYISYIYQKDFTIGNIEVPKTVMQEDLEDAIEIASFDELGLDTSLDYIIHRIELDSKDSENREFVIFAIPHSKVYDIFSELKVIKHIDLILPAPILFSALYKKNFLEMSGVDCFLHFDYEDTILSVYKDGKYLYSKSLTFSLKRINEEFAKSLTQHVDEGEFFKLLLTHGLMSSDSVVQKNLMKIFNDFFTYTSDVLQFVKRSNGLDNIDSIYISSKIGDIKGLKEFSENFLSISTKTMDLKISKNTSEVSTDYLAELMILYMRDYIENPNDEFNFSIFKKEPPFFTTPSGKLTKSIAAGLVISLLYPAYQMFEKYNMDKEYEKLSFQNSILTTQVNSMKKAIADLVKKREEIENNLKLKDKNLAFKTKLLKQIYQKKVSYIMKAKVLNNLFEKVNEHKTNVVKVTNHENSFILSVRSKNDKYITELIKDLAQNQQYKVGTNLIAKDSNTTYYHSDIKVDIYASR